MKKVIYSAFILLLISCDQTQTKQAEVDNQAEVGKKAEVEVQKDSKYNGLLSKFKNKSFDTLQVYSPKKQAGEYKGVEIDSTEVALFPKEIANQYVTNHQGIFAIYKFPLDGNRIGLIARTPAMYFPTSIKFFLYEKEKDKITSYIELAESWGDGGDYMTKDAWLYKDEQQNLKTFLRVHQGRDPALYDAKDTSIKEWDRYYLLGLSGSKLDTISKDGKALEASFSRLIKRQPKQ